jgi:hypothetical protein
MTPQEALAAALGAKSSLPLGYRERLAADALPALAADGWTLTSDEVPGCNHVGLDTEFARLRAIETAALEYLEAFENWMSGVDAGGFDYDAKRHDLRAALEPKP